MSLNIVNQTHFDAVCAEAEKRGILYLLTQQLEYLAGYACHEENGKDYTRCDIGWDFAPLSFSFIMNIWQGGKYVPWFNGGLIFHPGSTGPDESMSVELVGSREPHWSVHT